MTAPETTHAQLSHIRQLWNANWFWILPLLLGLVTIGRGITSVGLWSDEFYTANAVANGLGATNGEAAYLPYYTFVWLFTAGGDCVSELCLRYPSAVAMFGVIVLASLTARMISTKLAGLVAGFLIAISPAAQRFGQEARPFALAALLITAATFLLILAQERGSWPRWAGYTITMTASVLVLPTTLVVFPAHAILLTRRPIRWANYRPWLVASLATIPLILPAAIWVASQPSWRGYGDLFIIHYTNAWYAWSSITAGGVANAYAVGEIAMAVFLLGLLSPTGTRWLVAAAVGALGIWLASFGPYSWFMGRFFVPLIGIAAIGAGIGSVTLGRRRALAAMLVVGVAVAPAYTANRFPWARGIDYRTAINEIDRGWAPGDTVVTNEDGQFGLAWGYYAMDPARNELEPESATRVWFINDDFACSDAHVVRELGLGNSLQVCVRD